MGRKGKPWYRADRDRWGAKIGGRYYTLAVGKSSEQEALVAYYELKARIKKGDTRPCVTTLAGLLDMFLSRTEKDFTALTYEYYKRYIDSFVTHVGKTIYADDVKPYHVTEWADSKKWGPTTRYGAITTIKAAYSWGKKQGYVARNAIEDMQRPTPRRRNQIMTGEQAAKLEAEAKEPHFRDLLTALRETGARPSEVMSLEASMIDWGRGVAVFQSKTSERTGLARVIYLTPKMLELCARLATKHPKGPLFRNRYWRPWTRSSMRGRFARARKKLKFGPEATAESYRHMFATDALEKGVPIATVAQLMGHRSTAMLSRTYSHLHDRHDHLVEAIAKIRPPADTPPT